MKKTMSIALSLALFGTLLAACSNSGSGTGTGSGKTEGTPQGKALDPSVKKTFKMSIVSSADWPYQKDWPVWKIIEEKTGVTLDMQIPSGNEDDSLSLMVASGSMPDIMAGANKTLADKYGQQGALTNILDHLNDMPNLKKWMEKYPEETKYSLSPDGKMYLFPKQGISETNRIIWFYREDIFKKHGLKAPTTFDELYEVGKKLKELYPKSYPLAFTNGTRILRYTASSFATNEDYYYDYDKKEWRYGPVEDSYKKNVEYLNKFNKEGLIPPDWLTLNVNQWQDLISTDRSFITVHYIGRIDIFNQPMRKQNPGFTLAFMPPPAGPGGKALMYFNHTERSGMLVSSTTKQVKDVMRFMDFYYSDEARTLLSWGKEGEQYKVENGKKKFIEDYGDVAAQRKKTGLSTSGAYLWFDYDSHMSLASPETQKNYVEARKYDEKEEPQLSFTDKENEVLATAGQAITKHREENISKFILGQRSLDEWSKYVDEAKKLGIDKVLDTYKQSYERMSQAGKK